MRGFGMFSVCVLLFCFFIPFTTGIATCWGDTGELNYGFGEVSEIAAGENYACVISVDRKTISCNGTNPPISAGTPITTEGIFKSLSAAPTHICAIEINDTNSDELGAVKCWNLPGNNLETPNDPVYKKVFTSYGMAVGIKELGECKCWKDPATPGGFECDSIESLCPIRSISFTLYPEALIIKQDNTTIYKNGTENTHDHDVDHFEYVSVGPQYACGVLPSGSIRCINSDIDINVNESVGFESVHVGNNYVCGKKKSGVVVCWGDSAVYGPIPNNTAFSLFSVLRNMICGSYDSHIIESDNSAALYRPDNGEVTFRAKENGDILEDIGLTIVISSIIELDGGNETIEDITVSADDFKLNEENENSFSFIGVGDLASVQLEYSLFNENTPTSFAGVPITFSASSLKLVVSFTSWNFEPNAQYLKIILTVTPLSLQWEGPIPLESTGDTAKMTFNHDKFISQIVSVLSCYIDGTAVKEKLFITPGPTPDDITIIVPKFDTLSFDPNIGLLVDSSGSNSGSSGSSSDSDDFPWWGILIVVVGACAVVCVVIVVGFFLTGGASLLVWKKREGDLFDAEDL